MPAAGPGTRRIAADFIRAADFTDRRSISLVPQERISLRSSAQPAKFRFERYALNLPRSGKFPPLQIRSRCGIISVSEFIWGRCL